MGKHAAVSYRRAGEPIEQCEREVQGLLVPAEAADRIVRGMERTLAAKTVTYDLERLMEGARLLSCGEFGRAVARNLA